MGARNSKSCIRTSIRPKKLAAGPPPGTAAVIAIDHPYADLHGADLVVAEQVVGGDDIQAVLGGQPIGVENADDDLGAVDPSPNRCSFSAQ